MDDVAEYVLHYDRFYQEETQEFATLKEAEEAAEAISDNCMGFPTRITLGDDVKRDYLSEYAQSMKTLTAPQNTVQPLIQP